MAKDPLLSKPFSEGAPLDPQQLNNLRTDVLNTYTAATNLLFNNTTGSQTVSYKYVFNCGTFRRDLTGNSIAEQSLDLGTGFEAESSTVSAPRVVATIRSNSISKTDDIKVWVGSTGSGTNWTVYLLSKSDKKDISVDWVAIQKVQA